ILRSRNARNIPRQLAVLEDDSILVLAQHGTRGRQFVINRYDADGNTMTNYGVSGTAALATAEQFVIFPMADGSVNVLGEDDLAEQLTHVTSEGQVQPAAAFSPAVRITAAVFDDANHFVTAGTLDSISDFALARYST